LQQIGLAPSQPFEVSEGFLRQKRRGEAFVPSTSVATGIGQCARTATSCAAVVDTVFEHFDELGRSDGDDDGRSRTSSGELSHCRVTGPTRELGYDLDELQSARHVGNGADHPRQVRRLLSNFAGKQPLEDFSKKSLGVVGIGIRGVGVGDRGGASNARLVRVGVRMVMLLMMLMMMLMLLLLLLLLLLLMLLLLVALAVATARASVSIIAKRSSGEMGLGKLFQVRGGGRRDDEVDEFGEAARVEKGPLLVKTSHVPYGLPITEKISLQQLDRQCGSDVADSVLHKVRGSVIALKVGHPFVLLTTFRAFRLWLGTFRVTPLTGRCRGRGRRRRR